MIMRVHEFPSVGAWYMDLDKSLEFEIVAMDIDGNLEIQYFDGEIEEVDKDSWFTNMRVKAIGAPIDWIGPYELENDMVHEIKEDVQHPEDGHNPLDEVS